MRNVVVLLFPICLMTLAVMRKYARRLDPGMDRVVAPWQKILGVREEDILSPILQGADWAEMISVRHLPCPLGDAGPRTVNQTQSKLAVFLYMTKGGTARLRGDMLAAAIRTVPGWEAMSLQYSGNNSYRHTKLELSAKINFCVLVKVADAKNSQWCRDHGADAVYWDVLDSGQGVANLMAHRPLGQNVDVALCPDDRLRVDSEKANPPRSSGSRQGWQRSLTLYHQHTNPGFVTPRERLDSPFICRAAMFISSSAERSPEERYITDMEKTVCAVQSVWTFAVLTQQTDSDGHIKATLKDFLCPDRSAEMQQVCEAADATVRGHRERPTLQNVADAEGCFEEQFLYHDDLQYDMVDVVVIIETSTSPLSRHRPSSRLLFWMSHGVPVVFFPFYSYQEISQKGQYLLPNGKLPVFYTDRGKEADSRSALEMLNETDARRELRERGLAIATRYSAVAIAKQLVGFYENPPLAGTSLTGKL